MIVGTIVSFIGTALATRKNAQIERGKLDAGFANSRKQELRRLHRENLIECQEALTHWGRNVNMGFHEDVVSASKIGKTSLIPVDLDASLYESGLKLMFVTYRISDIELRQRLIFIRDLHTQITLGIFDKSRAQLVKSLKQAQSNFWIHFEETQTLLSELLLKAHS